MALLLAMYQKMRLIREKNQVTLDLTKYSGKLDRVTKNIERVQKRYTSLFAQLDQQAKRMESDAKVALQNMVGLGANCVNPNNLMGMNGFVYGIVGNMMTAGGYKYKEADGTEKELKEMDPARVQAMMDEYMANGKFLPKLDADNKPIQNEYQNGWLPAEVAAFTYAMRVAQTQQQQAQMFVQQGSATVGNNVSIWLDAQKAQLEAQQDAELEPLNYQETMWELEKTQADNKLKRINANLETYEQLVSQESEKSAPTFGLR